MSELLCKEEVYAIVGAALEVHKTLGCGFLEAVYQEALAIELEARQIPFRTQPELQIQYKDYLLNKTYFPDFICYDKVIVELKALDSLGPREEAQLINYLHASPIEVGVLLNFGAPSLEWMRRVHSKTAPKQR